MAESDYIDREYMNFLIGNRMNTTPAALGAPGSDLLKDQGNYLTQANKFGGQNTDIQTLIAMGALPSAAYADMLGPAEAPGFRLTQQWADPNQGTPLQNFIAARMQAGKNTNAIYSEIQSMIATGPQDEYEEAIVADIPRQMVQDPGGGYEIGEGPDLFMVRDTIQQLEDARNSDPDYEVVDGQAMSREESAATKAALGAGYVSTPGETYDPYSLAPEGTYERDLAFSADEQAAMQAYLLAKEQYDPIQKEYQQTRRDQKVFAPGGPADLQADLDDMRRKAGEATSALTDYEMPTSALSVASTGYEARPMIEPPAMTDPEPQRGRYSDRAEEATRRRQQLARSSARESQQFQRARRDKDRSAGVASNARYEDYMRQQMARELLNYGMSPFDDERNQRNRLILGG